MQTVKDLSIKTIKKLPNSCSLDDIMETLWIQKKILIGQEQIRSGQGISHDEAKKRLKKWLR